MSGIKLLPPFVLLVAGFLLCHSIPSWRRYVIRANGQQLTLRSAIAGFGAALPVFAVLYLLHAFSAPSASPYAYPDTQGEPFGEPFLQTSLVTLTIAIICLAFTKLVAWYYAFYLGQSRLRQRLAGFARRSVGASVYHRLQRAAQWCHWQSYRFTVHAMRKLIEGDHAETLYLGSLLGTGSGLCMFVLDSRKVIIGNVTGMPEPSAPKEESQIRVLPYFTGHLCEAHLQLHITTDYTPYLDAQSRGEAHRDYAFDIVLAAHKTSYVREFDIRFFRSRFINHHCPCGHPVYNITRSDQAQPPGAS